MKSDDEVGQHNKEVYAYFGLAYSNACTFEAGLVNALLYVDYLAKVKETYRGPETFDRAAYEAGFDAFMAKQQAATLGALIRRIESLAAMDADLKALVLKALSRRNFLAHRFFWERAVDFMTPDGRNKMIRELEEDVALFDQADHAVGAFTRSYRARVGLTDRVLQKWMARYYQEQGLAGEFRED
jgi:hypothetical protein